MRPRNILIVYAAHPTRATLQDSLYAFQRYSTERIFYLNLRFREVPAYIASINFDLIIFHTLFFSKRWDPDLFRITLHRARQLRNLRGYKIVLPQDEFINSDGVNEFINDFGINAVYSVQPPGEWKNIYNTVDFSKVRFVSILTGYIDRERIQRSGAYLENLDNRPIDIGYRTAGRALPWFGRHGFLKEQIAEIFTAKAREHGLVVDISTRREDMLLGNDWYDFWGQCKYTIGVEGGTSILDRDGSIQKRTDAYCAAHPDASFEEIEKECFPGQDGTFSGFAISPRHLEACVTGTCQILTGGSYNGILQASVHYISLKKDFSNIDDVCRLIKQDKLRKKIVVRAYEDIVKSGKFTYEGFVKQILDSSIGCAASNTIQPDQGNLKLLLVYYWMRGVDVIDKVINYINRRIFIRLKKIARFVPIKKS